MHTVQISDLMFQGLVIKLLTAIIPIYFRLKFKGITIHFYPNAWADQRIRQEFKSVIAGCITSYPPCG